MKDYGKVRSTIQPEPMVVDEVNVWVHSNIVQVEEVVGEQTFIGFEYDMIQYEKDEYIKIMAEKNQSLEAQLTDTQLALVEIYEGMVIA
ncbi:hypothetical protein SDC9_75019 [bioreactor metagenome]|uniref:Uncharacterized protein n=1 Tax=bioreactor metagenome TaxID=1076179 RepID=A0A644YPS5_9ZZZZ